MSRGLTFEVGGFYHVYNRGTEKRDIFMCESDYRRFITLLYYANSPEPVRLRSFGRGPTSAKDWLKSARGESLADLCAYCLMPNHFHLLIYEHTKGGVSRFLQKLLTSYTMYFNVHYERSGVLFQGKFKAIDANEDRYLKYLISYIHLNPVKLIEPDWKEKGIQNLHRVQKYLASYRYSSYLEFANNSRPEGKLISRAALPEYFHTPKGFEETLAEWLQYKNSKNI